jgi:hypothetical protein
MDATSEEVTWRFTVDPTVATFTFKVYVAAQVPYPNGWVDVSPPADTLMADSAQPLTATVRDVVGRVIPGQTITWGTSDAAIGTVTAGGVVTGVSPGAVTISASSGVRSGAAKISVCPNLAVGGVYVADMPAGADICLPGTTGGAEYTVMPMNLSPSTAGGLTLGLTSSGIVPASGGPNPARLPGAGFSLAGGLQRDDRWETRLRETERRVLGPLMARGMARSPAPRRAVTPGVPVVGGLMTLNVETDQPCSAPDNRTGRVVHVGTRIVIVADTTNPSGGLTVADYAAIAETFDNQVWPAITAAYGEPADLDQNGGRVIAFYTRAVNELTPPGSSAYVGGFVYARDLFEPAQCASSNRAEMFYMLAADPGGTVNGNVRTVELVKSKTVGTLAHEFEHLINASRRMYVNNANGFEATWLDEGLAHVAEELMFYHVSGTSARANLGGAQLFDGGAVQSAWFSYMESNTGRLRQWLLSPTTGGFFQANDNLPTRGAAWSFLRYAADRKGGTEGTFWAALVKTAQDTGLVNLQNALGTDPMPWARDFVAATYADDALGSGTPAQYTLPSWNVRDIIDNWINYTAGDRYPLAVRAPGNGVTDNITLAYGGSAAFSRVGVPASAFASVRLRVGGASPPSTVRVAVFRRK